MTADLKTAPSTPARKRWRGLRFSLATLFLTLTVGCVWLGFIVNRVQRQKQAIAMIERLGGEVLYSSETRGVEAPRPGLTWLRDLVGTDYLDDVRVVELAHTKPSDEDLAKLRWLPKVRMIVLSGSSCSDEDCRHLAMLPALEHLRLDRTRVSDRGLVHLGRCRHLKKLHLANCPITSAGLAHLIGLSDLEEIWLDDTQVDDSGITHLALLRQLKWPSLDGTKISDRGMKSVAAMPLERLNVERTQVTENGIAHFRQHPTLNGLVVSQVSVASMRHLATIPNLEELWMVKTGISESCEADLAAMQNLKFLELSASRVSPEVVARLRKLMPNCTVYEH